MNTDMKKLGFGLMRLPLLIPGDYTAIDIEQTEKMVDEFISAGYSYFDTAWMYHDFVGESSTKKFLTSRYPRETYQLATKMHFDFVKEEADLNKIFNEQLKNCGVDFFDYYLLHDLNTKYIDRLKVVHAREWILRKKEEGLVKHIGFSFHDSAEVLEAFLDYFPESEFVQLQINYLDWDSEGIQSRKCYEAAVARGKKIIVMEPVKGGTLTDLPESALDAMKAAHSDWSPASWALRYVLDLPEVIMVLSGMSNMEQVRDNIKTADTMKVLGENERAVYKKVLDAISTRKLINCTGCAYCTSVCPLGLPIPKYISLYNADNQEIETKRFTSQIEYYRNLTEVFPKASECSACRACAGICPQHLDVPAHMKTVAEYFEKK